MICSSGASVRSHVVLSRMATARPWFNPERFVRHYVNRVEEDDSYLIMVKKRLDKYNTSSLL